MKRILLALFAVSAAAACDGTQDTLTGVRDPNPTQQNPVGHANDPAGSPQSNADPGPVKVIGSPEVTSRLHGCGKLSVASIGSILQSRGLTGNGQRPDGAPSGMAIYSNNDTAAALGGPNYGGRVPEASFASTSAMSKMFDIFTMASYDAVATDWSAPACPDVKLFGADGKFTKDGISCLIGKPATDEHVAIANDALAKNQDGAKIAIAALLSAAHTCQ